MKAAQLTWRNGQPFNAHYQDIYFSDHNGDGGIAEVDQFYLQPAQIPAKLDQLAAGDCLVVGELGFGSGLNFSRCAQLFLQQASAHSQLHFISFEHQPFSAAHWQRVVNQPSRQSAIDQALADRPPPLLPGWHRQFFADGRIMLSLFHGEAADGLTDLQQRSRQPVDAWLLDGFAPARNPSLWTTELFAHLAKLSTRGTTLATFTAAGEVRRGLSEAGFNVRRVPQQPFKRESLAASWPYARTARRHCSPTSVQILGAGLGGATLARHLAEQHINVQVVEPNGIASGGSQIRHAILHGRLLGNGSSEATLRAQAFLYASRYYSRFAGVRYSGAMQVTGPNMNVAKMQRIRDAYCLPDSLAGSLPGSAPAESLSAEELAEELAEEQADEPAPHWLQFLHQEQAEKLAGYTVDGPALWFADAAVVDIPTLCHDLLNHNNIELCQQADRADCPTVLCNGSAARQMPGLAWLEIVDVFGQLDAYQRNDQGPQVPIVGNGYYVPEEVAEGVAGEILRECAIGATYEHQRWDIDAASAHNMQLNQHYFSATPEKSHSYRAPRCVSSDRVPLIGQLQDNLWIATGFGSMGTSMAPMAAAVISSRLCGWHAPVDAAAETLAQPQRFQERQARRGQRHPPAAG